MALVLPHSIFVHTPKTAGQWCAKVLEPEEPRFLGRHHDTPAELRKRYPNAGYLPMFCFVRHPATWHLSWYSERALIAWDHVVSTSSYNDEVLGVIAMNTKIGASSCFNEYLVRTWDHYKNHGFCSLMFRHYATGCDRIYKFEKLYEGLGHALSTWEPELNVLDRMDKTKPVNVRQKIGYAGYTKDQMKMVMEMESDACHRFNYHDLPEELCAFTC